MFASAMEAGTTTGVAKNGYALGLKSGTTCRAATSFQVKDWCDYIVDDSTGWKRNLTLPGELQLDICLPIAESNSGSNWTASAASFPWTPYTMTEVLYIGIQELNDSSWWICEQGDCLSTSEGLYVQCSVETLVSHASFCLSYIYLGLRKWDQFSTRAKRFAGFVVSMFPVQRSSKS